MASPKPMMVECAYLHTPLTIDGKTESNLIPSKFPNLTMEWVPGPFLKVSARRTYLVPAPNVKYTLTAEEHAEDTKPNRDSGH